MPVFVCADISVPVGADRVGPAATCVVHHSTHAAGAGQFGHPTALLPLVRHQGDGRLQQVSESTGGFILSVTSTASGS